MGSVLPPQRSLTFLGRAADDAATDGAAEEGEGSDQDDEVKDPRIKKLNNEAAGWRHRFWDAEKRIAELEQSRANDDLKADNRELRLRLAFERAGAIVRLKDVDAAWKLSLDDSTPWT
jgi:hypothetical protein